MRRRRPGRAPASIPHRGTPAGHRSDIQVHLWHSSNIKRIKRLDQGRPWRADVTPHDGGRAGRGRAAMAIGALLVGAVAAGALCLPLARPDPPLLAGRTGPWRVDAAVEVGVTSVGLLVAAWLACSALVAAMCLLVRAAGTTWRTGERLVHRYAPQVVRKALVLAVGAGIGLGMASEPRPSHRIPRRRSRSPRMSPRSPISGGW